VIIVDCGLSWPVTRVGERHVFQTGAYGGLHAQEYLHGSDRVARFLAEQGSPLRGFDAPAATEEAPEAEWGFEPALAASIQQWADRHGHPVHRMTLADPHGLSPAVADLHRDWLIRAGRPAQRLLVECPDEQVVATATQDRADQAQPDHARLVQLLQACGL
jgi:hypothetical protein